MGRELRDVRALWMLMYADERLLPGVALYTEHVQSCVAVIMCRGDRAILAHCAPNNAQCSDLVQQLRELHADLCRTQEVGLPTLFLVGGLAAEVTEEGGGTTSARIRAALLGGDLQWEAVHTQCFARRSSPLLLQNDSSPSTYVYHKSMQHYYGVLVAQRRVYVFEAFSWKRAAELAERLDACRYARNDVLAKMTQEQVLRAIQFCKPRPLTKCVWDIL